MVTTSYRRRLEDLKADYNTQKGKRDQLIEQIYLLNQELAKLRSDMDLWEKMRVLLQKTGEETRTIAKAALEAPVTNALQYIFGPEYQFEIELGEYRGQPTAEFYVVQDINGVKVRARPQDSQGGGIVDVVSLALRIAVLQLYNEPRILGPIILDEPGKHVDEDSAVRLATFLQHASKAFGRQIIMVTHQQHLQEIADRSFQVEIKGDSSKVKIIGGSNED